MTNTAAVANINRLVDLYATYKNIDLKIALVYVEEAWNAAHDAGLAVEANSLMNIYYATKREAYP